MEILTSEHPATWGRGCFSAFPNSLRLPSAARVGSRGLVDLGVTAHWLYLPVFGEWYLCLPGGPHCRHTHLGHLG